LFILRAHIDIKQNVSQGHLKCIAETSFNIAAP